MSDPIALPVAPPFRLDATIGLLRRRPANRIDVWQNGHYQRAIATAAGPRLIDVWNDGDIDHPALQLAIRGDAVPADVTAAIITTVRDMLGLDVASPPLSELAEIYPAIAPLASALRGFRPPVFPTLFEAAVAVLPFQQLSLEAGIAILNRLAVGFGPEMSVDGTSRHGLPLPAAVLAGKPDDLRAAGLSRTKVATLQTLAELAASGTLTRAHFAPLSTADILRELETIRGIGPWSAGLLALRGLRRLDVFPPGDVGAARGLAALLALPDPLTPAQAVELAAQAGPNQGYLYYLCLGRWLVEHNEVES